MCSIVLAANVLSYIPPLFKNESNLSKKISHKRTFEPELAVI